MLDDFSHTLDRAMRLIEMGFTLVPLGAGDDGKAPTLKSWHRRALGPAAFRRHMTGHRSTMYGIRLDDLAVVDVDVHDNALVVEIEERFGASAVKVQTPRGIHLYYRHDGGAIPNLRAEGLSIDVKAGSGHYVVGGGSIRTCGARYQELAGHLGVTPLTQFGRGPAFPRGSGDAPATRATDGLLVPEGGRHKHLRQRAQLFVWTCETEEELFGNLIYARDNECMNPATFPEDEVRQIAKWTFRKCQNNELYAPSGGSFHIPRYFVRALRCDAEALSLLLTLHDQHGHIRMKTFDLKYEAMKRVGLTGLSERAFHRAVRKLREIGALEIAGRHRAGKWSREYKLCPPPATAVADVRQPLLVEKSSYEVLEAS